MKQLLILLMVTLLISCNNNANTEEAFNDTVQEAGEETGELATLQHTFPQLFHYLKEQDPQFGLNNFTLISENKLSNAPAIPLDEKNLQPYKKLLIYNSDGSQAIDLYSYNYIITDSSGTQQLESAEPDTEVGLVHFASHTRKRIFFSGPSYTIWDGAWLQKNIVVLAGAELLENGKIAPLFLQINLADSTVKTFEYDGTIKATMQPYVNGKMKKAV
jgi:hypothetical protein